MVDANPIHSPVAFTCICTCHECDASPATNRPAPFGDHSLCARHFKGTPLLGKFLQHLCVHSPAGSFPNSFYYASRKTLPNGCVTFLHHRQRPLSQAPVAERPVVLPPATRERAMPIRPFLDGHIFDPETTRLMGIAFEMARAALRAPRRAHLTDEAIAARIIELAKSGERNVDVLCEAALNVTARITPSSWNKDDAI